MSVWTDNEGFLKKRLIEPLFNMILGRVKALEETPPGSATFETLGGVPTDNAALSTALDAKVPTSRTVAGHALTGNVTVSKSDVGLGSVDNTQQLPMSYLDTDEDLAANSDSKVASQKAVKTYVDAHAGGGGGGSGGPAPDYTPPNIIYKSATEIYLPGGRYSKGGYRHGGQYQDLPNLGSYWDIASQFAVNITGAYSAGASSGILGGKISSSWYSVFLMGNDANSVLLLPCIRVKTITYSAPNTIINPGNHATGASNENGFLTANDQWNNYRLVNLSYDTYDGEVFTIADCVDGTPDQLVITGDITTKVAAGGWLQLVPPTDTACLYLGYVGFDASGNLKQFAKDGWEYAQYDTSSVTPVLSTSYGNTELASLIPPVATRINCTIQIGSGSTSATDFQIWARGGTAGTTGGFQLGRKGEGTNRAAWEKYGCSFVWQMSAVSTIRNKCQMWNGSGDVAAVEGFLYVMGVKE